MAAPTGKGPTTLRAFRLEDAIYDPAKEVAAIRGETLTDVVRRAFVEYGGKVVCEETNPRRKTMRDNRCVRADLHNGRHCDAAGFEWKGKP